MKILLDESLPVRLKKHFMGHVAQTVADMGWQGKKNGELMALMDGKFDIFVTADQNPTYRRDLRRTLIPVIVLKANTCRYNDLKPLVPLMIKKMNSNRFDKVNLLSQN